MRWPAVLILLAFVLTPTACDDDETIVSTSTRTIHGSGNIVEEARDLSGAFSRIEFAAAGALTVVDADSVAMRIVGDDNLLAEITTEIRNGALIIEKNDDVNLDPTQTIEFHVSATQLDAILMAGAGTIQVAELTGDAVDITLAGAGTINVDQVDARRLNVTIAGAGNITVAGTVTDQIIVLSGVGDYDARNLASAEASITIAGDGTATVRVRVALDVMISGVGSVFYIGDPVVESTIAGSGRVERIAGR